MDKEDYCTLVNRESSVCCFLSITEKTVFSVFIVKSFKGSGGSETPVKAQFTLIQPNSKFFNVIRYLMCVKGRIMPRSETPKSFKITAYPALVFPQA